MDSWPIEWSDVTAARGRIADYLSPTLLGAYDLLDSAIGHGVSVRVKHENHNPTCAFKVRNGLSALTALSAEQRSRGVIAATRGNHGQGVAWAGRLLGAPVTICVPKGNSPAKNDAMVALGAELIVDGDDYDASVKVAQALVESRGLHLVHSTNDPTILAGAATITVEMLEQDPAIDAIVVAVGGGSQAVGAITAAREHNARTGASVEVFGVQADRASAIHDGWHRGEPVSKDSADTFADGLATRHCYELTFPALKRGLTDFVTVTEAEIAAAIRLAIRATHNLVEGAGAAGLAGLVKLADRLDGKRVGVIYSGGNIDIGTLERVLSGAI